VVDILEHVWSGTVERRDAAQLSPLARLLTSLLAAPTLCLTSQAGAENAKPFASYGGYQVLPGASLADVLDEELGIEISDETIVLFEPRAMSDAAQFTSKELGEMLGALLVDISGIEQGQAMAASDFAAPAINHDGQRAESHFN
jgi:hypothetical protein